ncbi:MAG: TIGR04219 family outer membrane beta-barrel protein [Desulfobacterales bacterium]|nr:TIGR04219 family outer membrane beta-barrel protein [Desulfobacterales bacterium]
MKRIVLAVGLVALLVFPAAVQAMGVEIAVGGWSQSPSGDLSYKAVATADALDLERDLKYDDEFRFMGRVKLDMPLLIPNIYLMATPMSFSGTGSKTAGFKFGDINFGGVNFDSEVTLDHYDVGLYYGIPFVNTATAGMFNVDAGLNVRVMDLKAKVTQPVSGSQSESIMLPIPMVYAAVQFTPIERISAEGEIRSMTYSGNSYYSLIGRLKVKVFGPAFAAAGYRYDTIEVDESDLVFDANIGGFFFEVGAEF